MSETAITIRTFYDFTAVEAPQALRAPILERMRALDIRGTITLAREGINATISGTAAAMESFAQFLAVTMGFSPRTYRDSASDAQPFKRSKVKVKRELISLGVAANPSVCVGRYVGPNDWNARITHPGVILIDTRNAYEFELGHFKGAINPGTRHFKQMVAWTEAHLMPHLRAAERGEAAAPCIAMYCTGGIRCEKYSSYLVALGFAEVYHLAGGILAYLEAVPAEISLWQGRCFVFDERVSVG